MRPPYCIFQNTIASSRTQIPMQAWLPASCLKKGEQRNKKPFFSHSLLLGTLNIIYSHESIQIHKNVRHIALPGIKTSYDPTSNSEKVAIIPRMSQFLLRSSLVLQHKPGFTVSAASKFLVRWTFCPLKVQFSFYLLHGTAEVCSGNGCAPAM